MKMTDLAIIFVVILLPMIIVVYVNTSFVIKAEKEEMYYKSIIDSSINDAVKAMKEIENINEEIDYGYSGIVDNKVSINADVAIDTFFSSLFNNFGIKGNESAEKELKGYIPLVAVFDYDGIYIHSAEISRDTHEIEFVTKPKQYYLYTYEIRTNGSDYTIVDDYSTTVTGTRVGNVKFQVVFTMDDYIYFSVQNLTDKNDRKEYKFYISDEAENNYLIEEFSSLIASDERLELKEDIVNRLTEIRETVITDKAMNVLSSTINKHNQYATDLGINYIFTFSMNSKEDFTATLDGIGMLAVVQGISLGNRYLDYSAYSTSTLLVSNKYLLANPIFRGNEEAAAIQDRSYLSQKLYHVSEACPLYKEYVFRWKNEYWDLSPKFFYKKAEAATNGYLPCPICKP